MYFDDETTTQQRTEGEVAVITVGAISLNLPKARFSSYNMDDEIYMLRKTTEGYTLYKETTSAEDGLMLVGKIGVSNDITKLSFIDTEDAVFDASFDAAENLVIQKNDKSIIYNRVR